MIRSFTALGLLFAACAAQAGDLYGLSGSIYEDDPSATPPRIYRIDKETGEATAFRDIVRADGSFVLTSFVGMAYLDGRIYVSGIFGGDNTLTFGTIDLQTGLYTGLSDQGGSVNWTTLAPDPVANVLYTVNGDIDDMFGTLRRIDPTDGSSVSLGRTFYNGQFRPLDTLAFDSQRSQLYGWSGNSLYTVDLATSQLALVGSVFGNPIENGYDMTYDASTDALYLQDVNGAFFEVDRETADLTLLGSNQGTYINGLAVVPVPEPASLAALGIGALALARRRRRS